MSHRTLRTLLHFVRAVALYGLFFAGTFALMLTIGELSGPAENAEAVWLLFNALGVGMLAVFVWATVELAAGVASIGYVQRASAWFWRRVPGHGGDTA